MAVINDSPNKGVSKLDARAATRLLSAAQEMDASQFVLVAPAAGSSGGGFLGNLFGRSSPAGGSGAKPSKLEQVIDDTPHNSCSDCQDLQAVSWLMPSK